MLTLFRQQSNSVQKSKFRPRTLEKFAIAVPFIVFIVTFSLIPISILLINDNHRAYIPTVDLFQW
jgi:hypothetical protein